MQVTLSDKAREILQNLDDNEPLKIGAFAMNTIRNTSLVNLESTENDDKFLVDSGADCHLINQLSLLNDDKPIPPGFDIRCANKTHLTGTHVGSIHLLVKNCKNIEDYIHLSNVVYVPDLSVHLLSIS